MCTIHTASKAEKKRKEGKKKRNGDFVFKEDESVSVVRANVYTYMHMQVE